MARHLDSASQERLSSANPSGVTDVPVTMSCWFYPTGASSDPSNNGNCVLVSLSQGGASEDGMRIRCSGTAASPASWAIIATHDGDSGNFNASSSTGLISADTWHHACATFTSATAREIFLDGTTRATNTSNVGTTSNVDSVMIGALDRASPIHHMEGRVAEVGIWDVALDDDEIAALASGFSPLFIRPQSLVYYAPLIRDEDEDRVGGLSLTATNTPTVGTHPRVFSPAQLNFDMVAAAAAGKGEGPFTDLSLMATPGARYSFSAKTPAAPATGNPWYYYQQNAAG